VRTRRARLPSSVAKDRQLMDRVSSLQEAYLHRVDALPEGRPPSAGLVAVRWMLEEYRVSLWDQARGTAQPVSDTRIRKALAAL
jgi:ATP-dependent helicase HrpA